MPVYKARGVHGGQQRSLCNISHKNRFDSGPCHSRVKYPIRKEMVVLKNIKVKEFSQEQKDFYNRLPIINLDRLFSMGDIPGLVICSGQIWGYEKEEK